MKSLAGTPLTPARLEKMRSHAPPLDPAPETAVERLLRHVDVFRTVAPTASALQRVDNPGEHAPVSRHHLVQFNLNLGKQTPLSIRSRLAQGNPYESVAATDRQTHRSISA